MTVGRGRVASPYIVSRKACATGRLRMFPDSAAAKGDKDKKYTPSPEAVAMQQMMRGIHF